MYADEKQQGMGMARALVHALELMPDGGRLIARYVVDEPDVLVLKVKLLEGAADERIFALRFERDRGALVCSVASPMVRRTSCRRRRPRAHGSGLTPGP